MRLRLRITEGAPRERQFFSSRKQILQLYGFQRPSWPRIKIFRIGKEIKNKGSFFHSSFKRNLVLKLQFAFALRREKLAQRICIYRFNQVIWQLFLKSGSVTKYNLKEGLYFSLQ